MEYLQLPASPYLWADKTAPATGKRFYRAVAMEPPENRVFIPPGTLRMGIPENEEERWEAEGPQTDVIITFGRGGREADRLTAWSTLFFVCIGVCLGNDFLEDLAILR